MNKAKKSNKPLILSIISIMLCTILLIGATIAWFTDTETNKGNTIQAGTLDIELYKWTGTSVPTTESNLLVSDTNTSTAPTTDGENENEDTWAQVTNDTIEDYIFNFDLEEGWQPGDTATVYLAVKNAGSLDFDYNIDLVVTDDSLADALQFEIEAAVGSIPTLDDDTDTFITVSSVIEDDVIPASTGGKLASDTVEYIALTIKLDESTGNYYQALAFEMDLILTATQQTETETVVKAYTVEDINGAEADQTVILMNDITDLKADIALTTNVNFDLNGYTLMVNSFSMTTEDYCTVDFANGEIWVQTDDVDINVPNGTVNLIDATFVLPTTALNNGTANVLNFTVSEHTLTTTNDIYVYNVTAFTISEVAKGTLSVESAKNVAISGTMTINGGVQAIIKEGSTVHGSVISSTDEDYILIYEGTITGEITGATTEGEVEEGTSVIFTASQLYDFLTSTDADDDKAILANDITYDTDTYGVMYINGTKDLDLAGYTITAPDGATTAIYLMYIDSADDDLTLHNGSIVTGSNTYGAVRSNYSAATLVVYDVDFSNSPYLTYQAIKMCDYTQTTITNCTFTSIYGGGVYADGAEVIDIYDCVINQTVVSDEKVWNSTDVAVAYGGTMNIYSGTYTSDGYGAYIFSSGGTINIYGGDWQADLYALKADRAYNSYSGTEVTAYINVYDGTFDGKLATSISSGYTGGINLMGGTFSNTELTLEEFSSSYVPTGYTATETSTGVYTVTESDRK